jgi:peroxisomal membrane protein 2
VEAWDAYNEALASNPLPVKSFTAGIILGAADLAGQTLETLQSTSPSVGSQQRGSGRSKTIDWARAARFAVFGLVLQAPWNHFYYQFLDGQIPPTPSEPFSQTNVVKVVIDQFVQAPIFTVLIFVFLGALEGKDARVIQAQLKNDYTETILANCTYIAFPVANQCGACQFLVFGSHLDLHLNQRGIHQGSFGSPQRYVQGLLYGLPIRAIDLDFRCTL